MARKRNDPLVRVDHADFEATVASLGLSPKELARRAGVSDTAVLYLLRDRPGGGRTQRIQLSTAQKLAAALGSEFQPETGRFSLPTQLDFRWPVGFRPPEVEPVEEHRRFAELLTGSDEPSPQQHIVLMLDLWAEADGPMVARTAAEEWEGAWLRLADLAAAHASPAARQILSEAVTFIGTEMLLTGLVRPRLKTMALDIVRERFAKLSPEEQALVRLRHERDSAAAEPTT